MTAAAGWYPDPSGPGQLRYWDGQAWTSSTAAAEPPAAAPSYEYAPTAVSQPVYGQGDGQGDGQQPGYAAAPASWTSAPYAPQQPSSSRKKTYAIVGAIAVVAAVIATVVPLSSGGGGGVPSVAKLTGKLLTSDKVGAIAAGKFTSAPSTDDNSDDDDTKADCKDDVEAAPGTEKADVGRDFTGTGQFAEEELSYTVGAAKLFTQLKTALAACHTLTIDGGQLALSRLADPQVSDSDDTLAMQAAGTISGVDFVFDIVAARFGNGVVEVTYGAPGNSTGVSSISNHLLQASAAKAKSAF